MAVDRGCSTNSSRLQHLVLDDRGFHGIDGRQRLDRRRICKERCRRKSTMITAQPPVDKWHALIGEPTITDANRRPPHSSRNAACKIWHAPQCHDPGKFCGAVLIFFIHLNTCLGIELYLQGWK